MSVEWDPGKAAANLKKHGVDFADAAVALQDENALTIEDRFHDEQRFKSLAMGPDLNVLQVVHSTTSTGKVRIISARRASRSETHVYSRGTRYDR